MVTENKVHCKQSIYICAYMTPAPKHKDNNKMISRSAAAKCMKDQT